MTSDRQCPSYYEYEPLPKGDFIRILKIEYRVDENGATRPVYSLHSTDIQNKGSPYYALSYTWGEPRDDNEIALPGSPENITNRENGRSIIIDGKEPHELNVQANLYDFLEQLASTGHDYNCLWIDALCINQSDLVEKAAQVQLVGRIYSAADRVIVWLGKDFRRKGPSVCQLLHTLAGQIETEMELPARRVRRIPDPSSLDSIGMASCTENQWLAIALFFSRRWFRRLWCVQELLLSRDLRGRAVVLLGDTQMPFEDLFRAAHILGHSGLGGALATFLARKLGRPAHQSRIIGNELGYVMCVASLMRLDRAAWPGTPVSLTAVTGIMDLQKSPSGLFLALCFLLANWDVTDSRDRIFAVLGIYEKMCLANDIAPLEFRPNYVSRVEDVYLEASTLLLQNMNCNLNSLALAGRHVELSSDSLPTWVISFRRMKSMPILTFGIWDNGIAYDACNSDCADSLLRVEGCRLHVTALPIGRISRTSDSYVETKPMEFSSLFHVLSELPQIYQYTGVPRSEALWRTLVCNVERIHEGCPVQLSSSLRGQFKTWLRLTIVALCMWKRFEMSKGTELREFPAISESDELVTLVDSMAQSDEGHNLPTKTEIEQTAKEFNLHEDMSLPACQELNRCIAAYPYHRDFGITMLHRKVFSTDQQHIGLCPVDAEPGDYLYVLNGARMPFILRPVLGTDSESKFQLIGEAYVHGIMSGEAMQSGKTFSPIVLV